MQDFSSLLKIIENEVSKNKFIDTPKELYEPINYVLEIGGKRIRPVMVLMACNLFSDDISNAIRPALGLEIFHNFTLLHDDIMDKAEIRRNMPTVHKKWNDNVAILSGDAMMIKAYEYFFDLPLEKMKKVLTIFNRTALEVCEGQQFDMNFENRVDVSEAEYLRMIELKTSVLLAASLKIGAIIGGAEDRDSQLLYEVGRNIGLAFQLQDDYLDTFGDVEVFGKKIGGDITANKKTYLMIKALELSDAETKKKLMAQITSLPEKDEEKINIVKNIYTTLNVDSLSNQKINEYFSSAQLLIEQINIPSERKSEIKKLMDSILSRNK